MKKFKFYHWLIIAFIGMAIISLGIVYVVDRSKNKSVQGTETQAVMPKVETPKTEVKKDEPKSEEPIKEETKTPVKETVTEPKYQSEPNKVITCDESRKVELLSKYMSDLQKISEVKKEKWDQSSVNYLNNLSTLGKDLATKIMNDERSTADMEYSGDKAYLDAMHNLDLKSINCSN